MCAELFVTLLCVVHSCCKTTNIAKMDFPDPEEEFEMMYADELEVMREMEGRVQHCSALLYEGAGCHVNGVVCCSR